VCAQVCTEVRTGTHTHTHTHIHLPGGLRGLGKFERGRLRQTMTALSCAQRGKLSSTACSGWETQTLQQNSRGQARSSLELALPCYGVIRLIAHHPDEHPTTAPAAAAIIHSSSSLFLVNSSIPSHIFQTSSAVNYKKGACVLLACDARTPNAGTCTAVVWMCLRLRNARLG
jgi:hypothetical protein